MRDRDMHLRAHDGTIASILILDCRITFMRDWDSEGTPTWRRVPELESRGRLRLARPLWVSGGCLFLPQRRVTEGGFPHVSAHGSRA